MSILLEQFIKELIAKILDESKKKKSKRGFWDNMWAKRMLIIQSATVILLSIPT